MPNPVTPMTTETKTIPAYPSTNTAPPTAPWHAPTPR